MKNTTELVGMTLLQRLRVKISADPVWIRRLAMGAWGVIYARAAVLGITGAFGAALVAGVGYGDSLPVCLGSIAGYLMVRDPSDNVGFVLLCAAVFALKLMIGRRRWEGHRWSACCTAGIVPLVVGFPSLFLTGASAADYLILAAQSLLSVATAYFVSNLYVSDALVLTRRGRVSDTSLMVCLCILAGGLVSLRLGAVSVGKMAAVLLTLCAAYGLGSAGGSAVGAASGLAVAFVSGEFGLSVALYALGGLISGAFRPLGRMGSAVAFVLTSGFVMLSTGRQMPLASFIEVMVGSVGFFALPETLFGRIMHAFAPEGWAEGSSRRIASERLQQTADALLEITAITRKVAQSLDKCADAKAEDFSDVLVGRVCRSCPKNTLCWVHHYGESQTVVNGLVEQLKRNQAVSAETLPGWFRQRCTQSDRMVQAAEQFYQGYAANRKNRRKAAGIRAVVVDQFEGMAMFLKGVDREIGNCCPAGALVTTRVREAFSRWGVEPLSLSCFWVFHRLEVEAVLPSDRGERVDWKTLSRLVGEAAGRGFALPKTEIRPEGVSVCLRERTRYRLKIGSCQFPQQKGSICGDTWRSFVARDHKMHILLSDGMGCGGQAALDSAMAVSLISCLLKAGADHDSALRMVNSSLLVKSGEESLATIDAASVDLYSGKVVLYKAGAAATVLRQGKKAGSIESVSSPAGILNGACFEHSSITLKEGDWLVMLSDGATAAGVEWIADELEHYTEEDPQELAQKLCKAAQLRRCDGRQDDITVICCLLEAESH